MSAVQPGNELTDALLKQPSDLRRAKVALATWRLSKEYLNDAKTQSHLGDVEAITDRSQWSLLICLKVLWLDTD